MTDAELVAAIDAIFDGGTYPTAQEADRLWDAVAARLGLQNTAHSLLNSASFAFRPHPRAAREHVGLQHPLPRVLLHAARHVARP